MSNNTTKSTITVRVLQIKGALAEILTTATGQKAWVSAASVATITS